VYDFPEHLRTFNFREQFTFICNPFQDKYYTNQLNFSGVTTNPLYDFQNKYLTVHKPVFIAGYDSFYSQSREEFFGIYPNINYIQAISQTGNGVKTNFTGTLPISNIPNSNPNIQNQGAVILQGEVLFSSIGTNGAGIALVDVPLIDPVTGNSSVIGNLYVPGTQPAIPPTTADVISTNTINYVTGVYNITFAAAPAAGATINAQTVPLVVSLPQALLYHNNTFYLRPVPDQPYRINFEVYKSPVYLMDTTSEPALKEYWQYIAYGAAKKIFEDRMDMESVQMIQPEFDKQQRLVLRRTIVQNTNDRVGTIYTENVNGGLGSGWGNFGGNF
jgi:hypothetical protein